jgi:PBSX family phage terminase large subunit
MGMAKILPLNKRRPDFKWTPFSARQKQVLTWWLPESPVSGKDGIIADGSVRSGKTLLMSYSFILWAMTTFQFETFGMAGKTIASFRRNVLFKLKLVLKLRGYDVEDKRSDNMLIISKDGYENYFYIFGGKDEASQDLVQGLTCAGFFFDEVALMPESFVNQSVARCSVEGNKLWFNCNPGGPFHWFKVEWIDKLEEKNCCRIQFKLEDNPSLSAEIRKRYERMFTGVFYERYVLGLWVMAEGLIYSMFARSMVIKRVPIGVKINKKWIGIDYGQANATVYLLVGMGSDNKLYILDEYYHSGRDNQIQKSPKTYAKDFKKWLIKNGVEDMPLVYDNAFIDPSAVGFSLQLREEGVKNLRQADNAVNRGIELISSIIQSDMLRILDCCTNTITEFGSYSWDPKRQEKGEDVPIKQNDHAMDALRYVVNGTRPIWQKLLGRMAA